MGQASLDKIIGNQLTSHVFNKSFSDRIEYWDFDTSTYLHVWHKTSTTNAWLDWDTNSDPKFGWNADDGYWIILVLTHGPSNVTFCGRVSKNDRSIVIENGRNFVGTCFPVSCALNDSGLAESGLTGHMFNRAFSDNIEFYRNATADYERFWYKTITATWQPWNPGDPMRDFQPGDAFWINVLNLPGHAAFTWNYPAPPNR